MQSQSSAYHSRHTASPDDLLLPAHNECDDMHVATVPMNPIRQLLLPVHSQHVSAMLQHYTCRVDQVRRLQEYVLSKSVEGGLSKSIRSIHVRTTSQQHTCNRG